MLESISATDPKSCRGCGEELPPASRFCPRCGQADDGYGSTLVLNTASVEAPALDSSHPVFGRHWNDIKKIALLFGLFLVCSVGLAIMASFDKSPKPEAYFSIGEAIIIIAFVAFDFEAIAPLLGRPRLAPGSTPQIVIVIIVWVCVLKLYFFALPHLGIHTEALSKRFVDAHWPLASIFILISIAPAIFEELAFRGYIQSKVERIVGPNEAIAIQAGMFAVAHFLPLIFISHFIMGLGLGWIRTKTKSLYPGMLMHATWNAIVLLQEF